MTVHFIGAGPGAPDLLTLRAIHYLKKSEICLYAGSIIPQEILTFCPSSARLIDTAPLSLPELEEHYITFHAQGYDITRLHSGDLSIYSAVAEQIRLLKKHNIPFTLTPGVPAFAAAASALERELTLPHLNQSLVITRLDGRASPMPEHETLEKFAQTRALLAIHLAIHRLEEICTRLIPFYGQECPVAVAAHISWPEEQLIWGTLSTIVPLVEEKSIKRTALILVGHSLHAQNFGESALYDPAYDRRFRSKINR